MVGTVFGAADAGNTGSTGGADQSGALSAGGAGLPVGTGIVACAAGSPPPEPEIGTSASAGFWKYITFPPDAEGSGGGVAAGCPGRCAAGPPGDRAGSWASPVPAAMVKTPRRQARLNAVATARFRGAVVRGFLRDKNVMRVALLDRCRGHLNEPRERAKFFQRFATAIPHSGPQAAD